MLMFRKKTKAEREKDAKLDHKICYPVYGSSEGVFRYLRCASRPSMEVEDLLRREKAGLSDSITLSGEEKDRNEPCVYLFDLTLSSKEGNCLEQIIKTPIRYDTFSGEKIETAVLVKGEIAKDMDMEHSYRNTEDVDEESIELLVESNENGIDRMKILNYNQLDEGLRNMLENGTLSVIYRDGIASLVMKHIQLIHVNYDPQSGKKVGFRLHQTGKDSDI